MGTKLSFALAFTLLVVTGAAAATSKPTPLTVSAKLRGELRASYARTHKIAIKRAAAATAVKAARFGRTDYALATFGNSKGQPELFTRPSRNSAHWSDRGPGKLCTLPSTLLGLFKLSASCQATPPPDPVPPTTTTPTTDPSAPPVAPPATPGSSSDLAVSSIAGASPSGASCVVTYTLANLGSAIIGPTSSRITVAKAGGDSASADQGEGNLIVNSSRSRSVAVALDCTSGSYTITVVADAGNAVAESDEQNNIAQIKITPSQTQLPDLVVSSLDFSADCRSVIATITNQGKATADSSVSQLAVLKDRMALGGGNPSVGALAPGQSQSVSISYSGPCSGVTLIAQADAASAVGESDESNNTLQVSR